jgi:hypothetical protein
LRHGPVVTFAALANHRLLSYPFAASSHLAIVSPAMKRFLPILLLAVAAQQQASQQDLDRFRDQQQQQELMRGQQEEVRKEEAAARRQQFQPGTLSAGDLAKLMAPQRSEPCLAQAMRQDASLDLQTIPLAEWLAAGDTAQIPWKVEFGKPVLRIDQRYEIAYSGGVQSKDMDWSEGDEEELTVASGISSPDGQWLIPPRAARQIVSKLQSPESRIFAGDCMFLKPGDYVLWMALYDSRTGKHNISKHRIRPVEFPDEPLPKLTDTLPEALFPVAGGPDPRAPEPIPGPLFLPISNKRPMDVELITVVSPADQWGGRSDYVQWINDHVIAATSVLSQMKVANGSMSATALDLINRVTPFQQRNFSNLDWTGLAGTFTRMADSGKISVPALETVKERSVFFRKAIGERLGLSSEPLRVIILVSGSMVFERGSDLTPVTVEGDCHCRAYHVRLPVRGDVFDDLERIIKPLHPKTFDVGSGHDMRKALAEIIHDLEVL